MDAITVRAFTTTLRRVRQTLGATHADIADRMPEHLRRTRQQIGNYESGATIATLDIAAALEAALIQFATDSDMEPIERGTLTHIVQPPLAEIDRLRRDHDAQLAALRAEIDQLRTTVEMLMKLNT